MAEQRERAIVLAQRGLFEVHRRSRARLWIRGTGGSMRPMIKPGDWLHVEFGAAPERIGEIVIFAAGDVLVAHRLVGRVRRPDAALLVTKGDALRTCDPPLAPADVIGVVRARRPAGGGEPTAAGCRGTGARLLALMSIARLRLARTPSRGGRG